MHSPCPSVCLRLLLLLLSRCDRVLGVVAVVVVIVVVVGGGGSDNNVAPRTRKVNVLNARANPIPTSQEYWKDQISISTRNNCIRGHSQHTKPTNTETPTLSPGQVPPNSAHIYIYYIQCNNNVCVCALKHSKSLSDTKHVSMFVLASTIIQKSCARALASTPQRQRATTIDTHTHRQIVLSHTFRSMRTYAPKCRRRLSAFQQFHQSGEPSNVTPCRAAVFAWYRQVSARAHAPAERYCARARVTRVAARARATALARRDSGSVSACDRHSVDIQQLFDEHAPLSSADPRVRSACRVVSCRSPKSRAVPPCDSTLTYTRTGVFVCARLE